MADIPPPPENPFLSDNPNPESGFTPIEDADTLDQGRPTVATAPGKVLFVVGALGIVLLILIFTIFSKHKKPEADKMKEKPRNVTAALVEPPPLPTAPPVNLTPPPAIIPPSIPEPTNIQLLKPEDNSAAKQQAMERMKSRMMVSDGGGGGSLSGVFSGKDNKASSTTPANGDPNSSFASNIAAANTKADRIEATHIGDLKHTIAQGRIIQATMESAINTDLPAPIRAIVSRDTYAEAGHEALIPKGSRLIGTYNTDISGAQQRVYVVWTRVIRPDGVDIMIDSPLVDQIGIAGVAGQVDDKFQSVFSRSLLSSVVSIAFAIGSDKISGGSTTTTNSALGGSSTTGDASTTATVNALNSLGSESDNFIKRFIDARPTILIDQGTKVNVFVNHDLVFPADANGPRIIN